MIIDSEKNEKIESLDSLYDELLDIEPKLVTNSVPEKSSGIQQKSEFLSGNIRNPDHVYDKLNNYDEVSAIKDFKQIRSKIVNNPGISKKQLPVYEDFIDNYIQKANLLAAERDFKNCRDPDEKAKIAEKYMAINIELYGKPEELTYRSLLEEKLQSLYEKPMVGEALRVRHELFDMTNFCYSKEWSRDRFKPSQETVDWMHNVVLDLYGVMLSHVPDKKTFTAVELKDIFDEIIKSEFGGVADGWRVDIETAKAIDVKNSEKRIVIPEDRGELSQAEVKKLIVHELGVHLFRSVTGEDLDLRPLRNGINDYYSSEEGIAKAMEQGLMGKYKESGVEHYITAGLSYFDKKDFRDIFETKWRMDALSRVDEMGELSENMIKKAKDKAYSETMRILRGTDELPWFKDLAYYNGAAKIWEYFESIIYDDIKFTFVLMGKADPSNPKHDRIMYEAKNKPEQSI